MQVTLFDRFEIDEQAGAKRTKDGYLVAMPRIARTGIQLYSGKEVGLKDKAVVRVYRPESEVFDKQALESLCHRPLTNDHPPEPVTAANWKKYATGQLGDTAVRDGEFVRVPMVMMDAKAIADYEAGKKQLSVGYSCDLIIEEGIVQEDGPYKGQAYDAIQRQIRGNHTAQCMAARGGDRLSIGDAAAKDFTGETLSLTDANFDLLTGSTLARVAISDGKVERVNEIAADSADMHLGDGYPIGRAGYVNTSLLKAAREKASGKDEKAIVKVVDDLLALIGDQQQQRSPAMKVVVIDGISCSFNDDQSAQIAERALATRDAALAEANRKSEQAIKDLNDKLNTTAATITTLTADKDKLTGENAVLAKQVKDAEITPDKLNAMVADREVILTKAKAIIGDKADPKLSNDDLRKLCVDTALGDAAKGFSADAYAAAFTAITAKVTAPAIADARHSFSHQAGPSLVHDAAGAAKAKQAALDARDKANSERWKGGTKVA